MRAKRGTITMKQRGLTRVEEVAIRRRAV